MKLAIVELYIPIAVENPAKEALELVRKFKIYDLIGNMREVLCLPEELSDIPDEMRDTPVLTKNRQKVLYPKDFFFHTSRPFISQNLEAKHLANCINNLKKSGLTNEQIMDICNRKLPPQV